MVLGAIAPLGEAVTFAFIYGSVARGDYTSSSDVDLMVIASARLADLAPALRVAEKKIERPINPTTYSNEEFIEKAASGHHFINGVLLSKKLFLKGDENDLVNAYGGTPRSSAHHD